MERAVVYAFLLSHARQLVEQGLTQTFDELARVLNAHGMTTQRGRPYQGGRGVASLLRYAYTYVRDVMELGDEGAAPIALAFTDRNGNAAYE